MDALPASVFERQAAQNIHRPNIARDPFKGGSRTHCRRERMRAHRSVRHRRRSGAIAERVRETLEGRLELELF
jgi:hypothetical protein